MIHQPIPITIVIVVVHGIVDFVYMMTNNNITTNNNAVNTNGDVNVEKVYIATIDNSTFTQTQSFVMERYMKFKNRTVDYNINLKI
jgi:hypothetical protein